MVPRLLQREARRVAPDVTGGCRQPVVGARLVGEEARVAALVVGDVLHDDAVALDRGAEVVLVVDGAVGAAHDDVDDPRDLPARVNLELGVRLAEHDDGRLEEDLAPRRVAAFGLLGAAVERGAVGVGVAVVAQHVLQRLDVEPDGRDRRGLAAGDLRGRLVADVRARIGVAAETAAGRERVGVGVDVVVLRPQQGGGARRDRGARVELHLGAAAHPDARAGVGVRADRGGVGVGHGDRLQPVDLRRDPHIVGDEAARWAGPRRASRRRSVRSARRVRRPRRWRPRWRPGRRPPRPPARSRRAPSALRAGGPRRHPGRCRRASSCGSRGSSWRSSRRPRRGRPGSDEATESPSRSVFAWMVRSSCAVSAAARSIVTVL